MKIGVVVFPGSNCDHDCQHVFKDVLGQYVEMIWHKETLLAGLDAIVLPGGFSYGDYLRTGAIARFSPVMGAVKEFAKKGGMVLGICNGFQILLEAGLLPGAMLRNRSLHFICKDVYVKVENAATAFTGSCESGASAEDSDRPCGWKLLHRSGHACGDAGERADRTSLLHTGGEGDAGGESERFAGQHCGNHQRRRQCTRHDAASGTLHGRGAGQ